MSTKKPKSSSKTPVKAKRKVTTKQAKAKVTKKKVTKKATKKATSKKPAASSAKSAKSPVKAALPAAKTKARTKASVKAPSKASATPPSAAKVSPAKAMAAKAPVRKKAVKRGPIPRGKLNKVQIQELATEDIWLYYRRVKNAKKQDAAHLEEVRNVLMELHYPLVKHIAERLLQTLPRSIELDDLISAGLFGLMDAIRGFDPDRGIKFKTYCTTRIRGSILDQLRSQDWVPRLVRLKAGKIDKALQRLQGEYGREPTHTELAETLEMEHGELSREISSARAKTMFSLSERWDDGDDDGSLEKVEILEDRQAIDPVNELNRRDLLVFVTRSLTHKERFIIEQYYQVGHTMREIGEMLALTESRVCQIHSNVMGRLKSLLNPKEGKLLQ